MACGVWGGSWRDPSHTHSPTPKPDGFSPCHTQARRALTLGVLIAIHTLLALMKFQKRQLLCFRDSNHIHDLIAIHDMNLLLSD